MEINMLNILMTSIFSDLPFMNILAAGDDGTGLNILNLLFVLLSALIAGNISKRLGYPSIFGELAAGIILGPALLGVLEPSEALDVLAEVGVLLMMLYIGMEIDPKELFKASWAGMLAAIGGFITPFALCYFAVVQVTGSVGAGLFVGIAAGVTSLATKSRILVDLKLLNTRIAHVLMAGALISDTLALIVFAAIIGIFDAGSLSFQEIGLVAGKAVIFFAVVSVIGLKVFPPFWRRLTRAGLTGRTFNATVILLIALLFAEFAELAGLHAILGAFLAGLFLREGTVLEPKLSHELNELVHDVSIGFLAPIFFVTAGFFVSLDVFQSETLLLLGAVTVLATIGKIIGTAVFYLPSGYGWREGLTVGAGMNGRGAVEIIIAQIGLEAGIITAEIFSVLVFMAIFTTATVPVFLKWTTEWLDRRGELVRSTEERKGVLILGAAPTARLLAQHLSESGPVCLIDTNQHNCKLAEAEGLKVILGNALDEDILKDADAENMRSFLALTPNPEVNVLSANLARDVFSVPDIGVLLTHANPLLRQTVDRQGFTTINAVWEDITEWDKWIEHGEVKSVDVTVEKDQEIKSLFDELHEGPDKLALVAERDGHAIPFPTEESVEAGDQIVALKRTP